MNNRKCHQCQWTGHENELVDKGGTTSIYHPVFCPECGGDEIEETLPERGIVIVGAERSGKTERLRQALAAMKPEDRDKVIVLGTGMGTMTDLLKEKIQETTFEITRISEEFRKMETPKPRKKRSKNHSNHYWK